MCRQTDTIARYRRASASLLYLFSLSGDQSLPAVGGSTRFLLQQNGPVRSAVPQTQAASTHSRSVLDLHRGHKLDRTVNLRLSLQNMLGVDIRRAQWATPASAPDDAWLIEGRGGALRAVMLRLEGKW